MKLKNFDSIAHLSPTQEFMIKACLATSKVDREKAVRLWEENVIMDDLDFSSSRLVPYFLNGNQNNGITTKYDKRLKIIYKHWWLRMQHINHQLQVVCKTLSEAGIDVVIIKGASIKEHYDRDELRPMADFDLLVPRNRLFEAIDVVKSLDYVAHKNSKAQLENMTNLYMEFNHGFYHEHKQTGTQVDLHWKIGSFCSNEFTENLWLHLQSSDGVSNAKKPQLAYEVFMIIVHAVVAKSKDNLSWIIDIAIINKKYNHSFWKEARKLAIAESKVHLFDYGCSILASLGIYAPLYGSNKEPKEVLIPIIPELKRRVSLIQLLYIRIHNSLNIVNSLYPSSSMPLKLYKIARHIQFLYLLRKFSQRIEDV